MHVRFNFYFFIIHCANTLKGHWDSMGKEMNCVTPEEISGYKTLCLV